MTEPVVIDPLELRAHPELLNEIREQPGKHVERRVVGMRKTEIREARADAEGWRGGGLAAVYDSRSQNLGGFIEVVKHGAMRKVLAKNPDVRALINHDGNLLLGRTAAGTLRLKDTPAGLDYEFDAPATSYADDLRVLMERGDITQSSFAFRLAPGGDTWEEDEESGVLVRTIHEFGDLYDVSPVTEPAYLDATSGIRSHVGVDDLLAQVRSLDGEHLTRFMDQVKQYDLRSVSQQDVRGVASQPDDQGDTEGLAQVEEPAQGGLSAAARARALQMLTHRAS